jgi:integrase
MPLELYDREGVFWVRGRPADNGNYVRRSLRTSDADIAAAKVRAIEAEARKRSILGPDAPKLEDQITFAACVKLYDQGGANTSYLKRLVKKLGSVKVREITPQYVRKLAREMMPKASTDTWMREVVTPVRAVINNAHELGQCPPIRIRAYDKAERVKQDLARGKESRVPKQPGSWPWLLAFMKAAEPRDAALAYFMFRHGYRIGQCIAMTRLKDMDLQAAKVRVHASKGHPAHWVDLDPEEVVMIANLPLPYRGEARDRVFTISGGRSGALYKRWKATCAKAGIPYLPPHSSGRHGYGTEMVVRQRVDPISAADNLWADPSVMLKTYSHSADAQSKVRDAFRVGLEAFRTQPVRPNSGKRGKHLKGRGK